MKVCKVFQTRSKAGILSAKNSMANSAPLIPITHQLVRISKAGGSASTPGTSQQPQRGHGGVQVEPGGKAGRHHSRYNLIAGKLHHPDRIVRRTSINPAK